MEIKKVGVVGCGLMGRGIAEVSARSGYNVLVSEVNQELLDKGIAEIDRSLSRGVDRGKVSQEEKDATLGRIVGTVSMEDFKDCNIVIEVIVEKMDAKKDAFRALDGICPQDTILASNTSCLSITEMAMVTKRPDRFAGMHWFNPPQLMRGIEVVRTEKTSPETLEAMVSLCKELGKEPGICKDSTGFIVNRLLQIWYNESLNMFDEGITEPQDIDTALKEAYNFRMGPFELRDMVGLDVALAVGETHYQGFMREQFKPPRCLVMKVKAGDLGRKTGRGFYEYETKA